MVLAQPDRASTATTRTLQRPMVQHCRVTCSGASPERSGRGAWAPFHTDIPARGGPAPEGPLLTGLLERHRLIGEHGTHRQRARGDGEFGRQGHLRAAPPPAGQSTWALPPEASSTASTRSQPALPLPTTSATRIPWPGVVNLLPVRARARHGNRRMALDGPIAPTGWSEPDDQRRRDRQARQRHEPGAPGPRAS